MRRYILYKILLESTSPPLRVLAHIYLGFCMFVNKHHVILKTFFFFILLAALLQDDDEADTVGCCTLKVENVKAVDPNTLEV